VGKSRGRDESGERKSTCAASISVFEGKRKKRHTYAKGGVLEDRRAGVMQRNGREGGGGWGRGVHASD
jgi:hypothetical protein